MSLRPDGADLNDACRERKRGVAKRLIQSRANLHYTNVRHHAPVLIAPHSTQSVDLCPVRFMCVFACAVLWLDSPSLGSGPRST